jgi:hypothetical protein
MSAVLEFADGNYRFIRGVYPYSAGIAPLHGYTLKRVRFAKPVPIVQGFGLIEAELKRAGRPLTALAACELRSPAPFTEEGFVAFNRVYVGTLERWQIFRDGVNPVARSNVCPAVNPPAEPGFHAFTYTVPGNTGGFVIAGSGEAPEGHANYKDHIVALGDTSPAGLLTKARWVLGEQERRLSALGFAWADVRATQVYTTHDIHPFVAAELVPRAGSVEWHFCNPPVEGLAYEMDCRQVPQELLARA